MKPYTPGALVAERYRILAPLGCGGMGHVYRAEHVGLHKEIALKVLGAPAVAPAVAQLAARFEREAHAIARLDHPNCVRVLDYGTAGGAPYLAMELLEGPTLAAALEGEGVFSPARAVEVARALLGALAHAHGRGVLHRDVKPENVILAGGAAPRAVLIDFGLASVRDAGPLTVKGMCVGSPSYIAPERLLGEPHTERSDVYAVGVILYELLAGAPPFLGSSAEEIMQQVLHRPPQPLCTLRVDVPAALEAIVERALARDPARRYADADEMRSALDELSAPGAAPAGADAGRPAAAAAAEVEVEVDIDFDLDRDINLDLDLDFGPGFAPELALDIDDAAQTLSLEVTRLEAIRPSPLTRLVSWLRFGRWRRRDLRELGASSC